MHVHGALRWEDDTAVGFHIKGGLTIRAQALPNSLKNNCEKVVKVGATEPRVELREQIVCILLRVRGPLIAQQLFEVGNISTLPGQSVPKKGVACDGNLRETSQFFQNINAAIVFVRELSFSVSSEENPHKLRIAEQ